MATKYRRILLKLSGEAFADASSNISPTVVGSIAQQLVDVAALGVEIGVVVGGGNIFRGTSPQATGMDRSSADDMGMLATVINALALQDARREPRPADARAVRRARCSSCASRTSAAARSATWRRAAW